MPQRSSGGKSKRVANMGATDHGASVFNFMGQIDTVGYELLNMVCCFLAVCCGCDCLLCPVGVRVGDPQTPVCQ